MNKIIIATRKSELAMWQSKHIQKLIENKTKLDVELICMSTKGDKILDTPLAKIGGKGLFTKELEDSMLKNEAHLAVHSLKDVPVFFPDGLVLAAISKREDVRDCFVSEKFASFKDLPKNAKVGTTSLRRKMQLLLMRPDLTIVSLRGNVNTRIQKLKDGEFDAIILATAGIKRLNFINKVCYAVPFSLNEMIPAMGQGALGIECIDSKEILNKISFINDEKAFIETTIERNFVKTLNGGCQVPIGINATLNENDIKVRAIVGLPDGSESIKEEILISKADYKTFGEEFAQSFIKKGAKELLARAEKMVDF